MASVLPRFGDVALAAIFTFWFIPRSGSSRGGPTAGRRGDSAGVTSALWCRLCRRLALLFVRPFNVVKRHVTGDPPTPGREETRSGAAAIPSVGRRLQKLQAPRAPGQPGLCRPCLAPGCCAASSGRRFGLASSPGCLCHQGARAVIMRPETDLYVHSFHVISGSVRTRVCALEGVG